MASDVIEIRWAAEVVGRHYVAPLGTVEVWDPEHFSAAQYAALSKHRGHHLALVLPDDVPPAVPIRLEVEGDVDVAVPDLSRYETGAGS